MAGSSFAQEKGISLRKGAFSAEVLSYLALGDHFIMKAAPGFDNAEKNSTEIVLNLVELRIHPYETGLFAIGVDFDWDQYRLNKSSYWMPDTEKTRVAVASIDNSGYKKIKKSNLVVRTLSFPVSFEQNFGKCAFRIGAVAEYNFPGITRFKAIDSSGAKVKETRSGARFANKIKTNEFTYSAFASISFGGLGGYVKYNPMEQFVEGYGPGFKSVTLGIVYGLGM